MVPSGQVAEKQEPPELGRHPELKSWRCLVFYLCFYGFMAQMRPGESFITPYLLGTDKNFTQEQVTNEITPVLSYSYLAVLVPVFLLTDYLRYKPVLVLQGLSYVSVWLLLLLGDSVLHMQFMELFYSLTMAARIAYSSYVFSLVCPARYQRMAGYSRTAVLLGVFASSVLGQLLVTVGRVPFSTVNYISLGFLTFSLLLALFLKRPRRSLFFNRAAPARHGASPSELDRMNPAPSRPADAMPGRAPPGAWRDWTLVRMFRELGDHLRLPQLRLWSLWWVFNSAAYYLIVYYVHILWNVVHPTTDAASVYNGGADAASTLLGAITSFSAGFVKIRWAQWAKLVIAGVTAVQAALVFLMYSTSSIWLCYVAFVLFRGAYQFLVPIATALCPGVRSQHVLRHRPQDHRHPHRCRQAVSGPPGALAVPRLLRVLPSAVHCLPLGGHAGDPAAPPGRPPPAPSPAPAPGGEGRAGAEPAGQRPQWPEAGSPPAGPGGQRVDGRAGLSGTEPAARGQSLTQPGLAGGQAPLAPEAARAPCSTSWGLDVSEGMSLRSWPRTRVPARSTFQCSHCGARD
ncbi:reduced folate transporter isoform X1 [Leopardus geoffroyi]|uniref:reduced folate transporter isoform X1 n=2 Tax=Leopardus geoffroyi TaxID=46844 RepID=UPI001E264CE6|nr:reduced folate transporter isoform X1 [Leopardus geoffroyi]XP_045357072.1 reduced folate transporter isoform X1 [Leopardus geoffroyi]XP_045357073.1 reduced folate transporter isoform X1 [Leopardus geoffroyi]XP_045357074.1 reduced folate transporter isoform X1 [Leopardus geoffroyi]XP_045357075.1 reduced folate transporter isoform X1 [Leopardus geoffroyi]